MKNWLTCLSIVKNIVKMLRFAQIGQVNSNIFLVKSLKLHQSSILKITITNNTLKRNKKQLNKDLLNFTIDRDIFLLARASKMFMDHLSVSWSELFSAFSAVNVHLSQRLRMKLTSKDS